MKSSPEALLEVFLDVMRHKDYNTAKKIFLCVMCSLEQLLKHVSLITLSNVFQEFQVIYELLNALSIQ